MKETARVCRLLRAHSAAGLQNTTAEESSRRPAFRGLQQECGSSKTVESVRCWWENKLKCANDRELVTVCGNARATRDQSGSGKHGC